MQAAAAEAAVYLDLLSSLLYLELTLDSVETRNGHQICSR